MTTLAKGRPVRIQRKRTKGWKMPPNTVYVGRPSVYGNPYYISDDCQHLSWFRSDLLKEAAAVGGPSDKTHEWSEHFWRMSRSLYLIKGRNLACWCAILDHQNNYTPCHADVLLSLANDIPIDEVIRENSRRAKGETL